MVFSTNIGINLARHQSRLARILKLRINPTLSIFRQVATNPTHDINVQPIPLNKRDLRDIGFKRRQTIQDEEASLFPMIEKLDLVTENGCHTLKISCDKVISLINLGAINKSIAVQYYHYLIDLARKSDGDEDGRRYILNKVNLVQSILLKRDVANEIKYQILSDASSLNEEFCINSSKYALENPQIWETLPLKALKQLLVSCLNFQQWDLATTLLKKRKILPTIPKEIAQLYADAFKIASIQYTAKDLNEFDRNKLKNSVLSHTTTLFEQFSKTHVTFEVSSRQDLVESLERFDYHVVPSPRIKSPSICANCKTRLPLFDQTQLASLHSSITDLLSTKYNDSHHINASPGELDRFKNFIGMINGKNPIDCVIDGLNIAMRHNDAFGHKTKVQGGMERRIRRQNPASSVVMLVNTILRCNMLEKFKSIVLIGKQHMYSWPGLVDFLQKSNIAFFFSKDHSKDDLFMLYTATLNPKTTMISCDLFRDHAYRLNENQRIVFERWQDTNQGWINSRSLEALWPTPYHKIPHFNEQNKTIHIPLVDRAKSEYSLSINGPPPYLDPKALTWLCCSPKVQ